MNETTETIMNIAFTILAVYGTYVLIKWRKAAQKLSKMCDEIHEETAHPTKKGGGQK